MKKIIIIILITLIRINIYSNTFSFTKCSSFHKDLDEIKKSLFENKIPEILKDSCFQNSRLINCYFILNSNSNRFYFLVLLDSLNDEMILKLYNHKDSNILKKKCNLDNSIYNNSSTWEQLSFYVQNRCFNNYERFIFIRKSYKNDCKLSPNSVYTCKPNYLFMNNLRIIDSNKLFLFNKNNNNLNKKGYRFQDTCYYYTVKDTLVISTFVTKNAKNVSIAKSYFLIKNKKLIYIKFGFFSYIVKLRLDIDISNEKVIFRKSRKN